MGAIILKNLLQRRGRTILTVLGISIGVAAIISLGAMAVGVEAGYTSMITGSQADLVLSQSDSFDVTLSSVDERIGNELASMPEVAAISGMLSGILQTEGSPYFFVFGYPEGSFILDRFQVIDGVSIFDREAKYQRGKPMMLGSAAAETLKKKPGDTMRLGNAAYRVVGIYETGDAFEDSGAVFDLPEAQELLGKSRQVSLFYIQLKEKDADLSYRLIARVERLHPDLLMSTTSEYSDKQVMGDTLQGYVWGIAGLAIVLGGIGMMNTQLMSVFERTREIGVLLAVGWKRRQVLTMILGESILVCLSGGIFGIFLGWLMVKWMTSGTVLFGAGTDSISVGLVMQALVVVLVLGLTGGIYPAYRATRLHPIDALRYEGGGSGGHARRLPFGGMAVQSLWQRTTRTILTLSVIGITVGVIMAIDGMSRGLLDDFTGLARGMDAEIMVRQEGIADTGYSAIDERVGSHIAAMPEVAHISGMNMTAIMMPEAGGFFMIFGYAPNEYAIRRFNIIEGQRISTNRQIMLGRKIADTLNKNVGETIELSGIRFRIVGIYQSSISWEELGGITTLRDAQTFMGRPRKVMLFMVNLHDPRQANTVVEKINQIPEVHAALSGEFVNQMPDMEAMDAMMMTVSFLAVSVGGLGMMNTMLMAVLERTREIGVLRAVGWRRRQVLGMIVREALLLASLGAISGVIIAYGLSFLLGMVPMIGDFMRPIFEWHVYARAILVALLLGMVGGLYPAYRATKLQPVEALRYE